MAAGLVDKHRLWVALIVLGTGKRLFDPGLPPQDLRLVKSTSTSNGNLILTYRPAEMQGGISKCRLSFGGVRRPRPTDPRLLVR